MEKVGADTVNDVEGNILEAKRQGFQEPTGVKDRSTLARQRRELGRAWLLRQG